MEENVRWTLTVSRETDQGLRSLLSPGRLGRGALSRFVEQAVRREIMARTLAAVRSRNAKARPTIIEAEIAEALAAVRARGKRGPASARR